MERALFTKQYENEATREHFIHRTGKVLTAAMLNEELRSDLYSVSIEGLGKCVDRVARGVKILQKRTRNEEAKDMENAAELSDFGRDDWIEDTLVHLGSLKCVEKNMKHEETQFALWYETQVGPEVNLTTASEAMTFQNYAGLTPEDKKFAVDLIDLLEQGKKEEALEKIKPLQEKVAEIEAEEWRVKQARRQVQRQQQQVASGSSSSAPEEIIDLPPPSTREPLLTLSESLATKCDPWKQFLQHTVKPKIDVDITQEKNRIAAWDQELQGRAEVPVATSEPRPVMPTQAAYAGRMQEFMPALQQYQADVRAWTEKCGA